MPFPREFRTPAVAATALLSLSVLPLPSASAEGTQARVAFVEDTNAARDRHALPDYDVRDHLNDVAQQWAEWMADHETLRHNPNLDSQVDNWSELGENIGSGPGEPSIQGAFMDSAPHRDNILSPTFRQFGVGAARSADGTLYVDEVFRRPR